jgi:hypothetical protein
MRRSQSSPPSALSPPVASTSNTPCSMAMIDTSKVPPPRSNTAMIRRRFSAWRCAPYASAAAVGSLRMRTMSSPAMAPASRVAWRCTSSK